MSRPAMLVDLDGTLFIVGDRSPYDADLCGLDTVNPMVRQCMDWARASGWGIVLLTARGIKETHRYYTEQALLWNGIAYDDLIMREVGDSRPDVVVKRELYDRFVADNWDAQLVLEDTLELAIMWREEKKIPCFQVDHRRNELPKHSR